MATKKELPVLGMSCAACAVSVESTLSLQKGIVSAQVNYANHSALLEIEESEVSYESLKNAIQQIGYDLVIEKIKEEDLQNLQKLAYQKLKRNTIAAGILAFPVFVIGMFFMHMPYGNWIMWALTSPILFVFGKQFFVQAVKQAKNFRANMDTLVAMSTGVAYIYSTFNTFFPEWLESRGIMPHVYFEAAAVIIFFILLGRMLESGAKAGTGEALRKLMGLQPDQVAVWIDGEEKSKKVGEVRLGEILIVKPGQKVALDGELVAGESFVDESMLTGEPLAVRKKKGDKVYAGTINQQGSFRFQVNEVGEDTLLAKIIQRVKEAQGSKAPIQKLVDRITAVFVPVVLALASLTLFIWGFSGLEDSWLHGMLAMITVMVIACPCALGLATPTAIMAGIGKAASMGILIKDAESFEQGHKVDTLILDKTGTITKGEPIVQDTWIREENPQLGAVIAALEAKSEHPLAHAITEYFKPESTGLDIEDFNSSTGNGVSGSYGGKLYRIGKLSWLVDNGISEDSQAIENGNKWLEEGKTVVFVAEDTILVGVIAISDQIKESSEAAILEIEKRGIEVHMLTGDQEKTAKHVAKEVGIRHYQSAMLPSEKAVYIKALQKNGRKVAMAGDGINDSEALALADLSIAMAKGTDIAMDVSKVTLMQSDLMEIPKTIRLAKKTVRTIRQNLFWAFIYNVIGIPIAAGLLYPSFGFLLNPMIAGAAMALSSVSVVSNSLRLKYLKL